MLHCWTVALVGCCIVSDASDSSLVGYCIGWNASDASGARAHLCLFANAVCTNMFHKWPAFSLELIVVCVVCAVGFGWRRRGFENDRTTTSKHNQNNKKECQTRWPRVPAGLVGACMVRTFLRPIRGPDSMAMRACGYCCCSCVVYVLTGWTKTCVYVPQTAWFCLLRCRDVVGHSL